VRDDVVVLDVVADTDLERSGLFSAPRRLRFLRGDLRVDVLVHDSEGDGLQALLRLTPPERCVVRASTMGHQLTVLTAASTTDAAGAARLLGLPRGVTAFELDRAGSHPRLRTAWIRL
jgi:hypothetical protein